LSIEIIGMVGTKEVSESRGSFDGPPIDAGYLTRFAQAHEAAGFDRVLIGYGATGPAGRCSRHRPIVYLTNRFYLN
jgi:alkanesulfonate monooxygenase